MASSVYQILKESTNRENSKNWSCIEGTKSWRLGKIVCKIRTYDMGVWYFAGEYL